MNNRIFGLRLTDALARVMIGAIFVSAGIDKLKNASSTRRYMKSKNLPLVPVMLAGAVVMEVGVAPALVLGLVPRWTAAGLVAFMVPTSLIFHDFWTLEGQERRIQQVNFMKNIAITGGLLAIALNDYEREAETRYDGEFQRPDYLDQTG